MSAPPLRTAISDTYPNPSNATARIGFGVLWDYVTTIGLGNCRCVVTSGNIYLMPHKGNHILINGKVEQIPSGGVGLAPTGLTVGNTYYVYAYMASGVMTLEASATGHSTESNFGAEVKATDITRTLVCMARIDTGPTFVDTAAKRYMINWFNRRPRLVDAKLASTQVTASTTPAGLLQVGLMCWANECIPTSIAGALSNSAANGVNLFAVGLDSSTSATTPTGNAQAYAGGATSNFALSYPVEIATEGYHFLTMLGWVTAGNGSFNSGAGLGAVTQG